MGKYSNLEMNVNEWALAVGSYQTGTLSILDLGEEPGHPRPSEDEEPKERHEEDAPEVGAGLTEEAKAEEESVPEEHEEDKEHHEVIQDLQDEKDDDLHLVFRAPEVVHEAVASAVYKDHADHHRDLRGKEPWVHGIPRGFHDEDF